MFYCGSRYLQQSKIIVWCCLCQYGWCIFLKKLMVSVKKSWLTLYEEPNRFYLYKSTLDYVKLFTSLYICLFCPLQLHWGLEINIVCPILPSQAVYVARRCVTALLINHAPLIFFCTNFISAIYPGHLLLAENGPDKKQQTGGLHKVNFSFMGNHDGTLIWNFSSENTVASLSLWVWW